MARSLFYILLPSLPFIFSGCNFQASDTDLTDYIAETKRRPSGQIEPLPLFKPYETFAYSAMRIRSPFELPVVVKIQARSVGNQSIVKPDVNRPREVLESFNFNELSMVGSIEKEGTTWVLIDAGGEIHRVRNGNYMGKNHGKIIALNDVNIDVIEIVADGAGSWIERPRTIGLNK
jgi:type IV pilus assembly protein PilP